ncbi:hypothetical protein GW756_02250 [bacterium]|nr:hypothetical protein [bacterium]NCQ55615.1 hypothetical protein [Candidatus Parcubacteria bacterium]NCS67440.1 hypothetical protein [Candidatus Peregrinibacteria bacterium]NCS96166.1 hypothetical protein [bacterium]
MTLHRLGFVIWAVVFFAFAPSASAKLNVSCSDSDGGINIAKSGEVTIKASNGETVLLERTFRDRNWLGKKSYVEFFCDDAGHFPKYKLIDCALTPSSDLAPGACPSADRGSIMLEAKHASQQPTQIIAQEKDYLPFYAVSLIAPVENVWVSELRFEVLLNGLERGQNTWVKIAQESNQLSLGQAMLAWENVQSGIVVVRFDEPLLVKLGTPLDVKMSFQGLAENGTKQEADNQISVTIKDLKLASEGRFYYESKPQINKFYPN